VLDVYRRCSVRVFGSTLPMAPKAVCSMVGCDHKGFKVGMIKVTEALLCLPAGLEYKELEEAERYICSTHKKKYTRLTKRNSRSEPAGPRLRTSNPFVATAHPGCVRACVRVPE
jgi:hypothetical protein